MGSPQNITKVSFCDDPIAVGIASGSSVPRAADLFFYYINLEYYIHYKGSYTVIDNEKSKLGLYCELNYTVKKHAYIKFCFLHYITTLHSTLPTLNHFCRCMQLFLKTAICLHKCKICIHK